MYIENLINEKLKNIVFLELKNDTNLNGYLVKKDTPLPINLENLMEGIKEKDFENNIDLVEINKAIVYLLGIEETFKYREIYLEILNHSVKDLYSYIYGLAILAKNENENLNSYIYLLALNNICEKTIESRFAEINVLEALYDEYIEELDEKERTKILSRIIKEYETIISEDPEYAPVYYRLGYVNRALSKYLKSRLYFEKFLNYSDNEILKNEVREVLEELNDYANIESVKTYISYGKFEEAYIYLQEISGLYPHQDEVNYYFGLCDYNLGNIEDSIIRLEDAIRINKNQEEYYNQLAISNIALGREEEAVRIYKDALFYIKDSYTIYYNLSILMINLGLKGYEEYLKKAYQLNPNEELLKLIEM